MDEVNISGLLVTPLKVIPHPQGKIYHGIKRSDPGFLGFGEVYFSHINHGETKAWKKHLRMTLNLVVPEGEVLFVIYDDRPESSTTEKIYRTILSPENYCRITVPPGLWVGFKGLKAGKSIILNFADLEHDPAEIERCDLGDIPFDWDNNG